MGSLLSSQSLPILNGGQYAVGCADLMTVSVAAGNQTIFARIFYPADKSRPVDDKVGSFMGHG